jgi:hypothetical protein
MAGGGCSDGEKMGTVCASDEDCAFGLQCFKPSDTLQPICTIGCAAEPCETGLCITSVFGEVCATACEFSGECQGDLTCQVSPSAGESVCWYPDENLAPLPEGLFLSSAKLTSDTNNDGMLNPGETAVVQFYPTNASAAASTGVWAELVAADTTATITTCKQPAYPAWLACSAACSCEPLDPATRLSVEGLSTSVAPVLQISMVLAPEAPPGDLSFKIRIHDDTGESWESVVSIPVVAHQAAIVVHKAELVYEENGDGLLSPGEEAVVHVTVANFGMTQVQGLYAELGTADQSVEVLSCAAPVGGSLVPCDLKCSCAGTSEASKQTLEPAEVGSSALLEVRFRVSATAAPGPLDFGVNFFDALGTAWASAFTVEVAPDEAKLVLAQTEILEDANGDGYLSPGESASVQVFVRNAGNSKALGVWAELLVSDPMVAIEACSVGVGSGWSSCGTGCSCEDAPSAGKQHLEPGETGTVALLVVRFEVHTSTAFLPLSFQVAFHDSLGSTWVDTFEVEVFSPDADLEVASVSLLDDSNADGFLSPAEEATVEIYARNIGTSRALAIYAALASAPDTVEVFSCYTHTATQWEICNSSCSCAQIPDEDKQTIESFQSGEEVILQVNFALKPEAQLEPVVFEVAFYDAFGNTWVDSFQVEVVAVKANIQVESVEFWGDSNGDGLLTPGESAKVEVVVKNSGIVKTFGLYAELTQADSLVDIAACYAETGETWAKCDSACNCYEVTDLAKQSLEAGALGDASILRVNFELGTTAPPEPITFDLTFHDQFGNTWDDSFILDVELYAAEIGVGFTELIDDTNGDSQLSPGESATAIIYPKNAGTVKALGVWAQLISVEPGVTVSECYAGTASEEGGAWVKCSASCACEGLFDAALQDLEPEATSDLPMLKMNISLDPDVSLGPMTFGIGFVDSLGLMWTDVVVLDVVAPDTDIGIGLYEIQSDTSGDGILNPGESMTIDIYAENQGNATALGVWARLLSPDPNVLLTGCYAKSGNNTVSCGATLDGGCSCVGIPTVMKVDIPGNSSTEGYMLRMGFELAPTAAVGLPIPFQIQFVDSFSNVYDDAFTLDVVVLDEGDPGP